MLKSRSQISGLFSSVNDLRLTKNRDYGEFGERYKSAFFTDTSKIKGFLNVRFIILS